MPREIIGPLHLHIIISTLLHSRDVRHVRIVVEFFNLSQLCCILAMLEREREIP